MAWTYDCDYNLQAYRVTPTAKRQDIVLSFNYCNVAPLVWQQGIFFDKYLNGSSYSAYSNVTAYTRGDRVNYQNRVYECTNDTTGNLPIDRNYWYQILGDFRGVTERIKYNCQKLMIEWVLNKWFGTTFNQPSAGNSDIYIVDNVRDTDTFLVAATSVLDGVFITSETPESAALMDDYIGETPTYSFGANFEVFYPVATITSTTSDEYYQLVNLVNKYKIYGSTVEYTSY